jgi:MinD superfamily P-loop ATPase
LTYAQNNFIIQKGLKGIKIKIEGEVKFMKIAVLSGKGGTGKTFVSVNLASSVPESVYVDCDVEEPNGHLFFKPKEVEERKISVKIPVIDHKKCDGCRACIEFCRFNALAFVGGKVKVFNEVCHSCGGCKLVCPKEAITEIDKVIGEVQKGVSGNNIVYTGILKIGEVSGVPIIKELLEENKNTEAEVFIDCPPGSACVVMESIKDADYCVLVAEPTAFGLHNLNLVYELVKIFKKPYGVIINKVYRG